MIETLRSFKRLFHIFRILWRYRLDEWVLGRLPGFGARLLTLFRSRQNEAMPRGMRLRLALEALGPIFVKFGQILSTRRDLLPADIADELALLQDQVGSFAGSEAVSIVEQSLGQNITQLFSTFDINPLASASIAQVHAATLHEGPEVVVKVLRPGIRDRIEVDLSLLRRVGKLAQRFAPDAQRMQPMQVVAEIERTLRDEIDLQREGANACVFRRYWEHSTDLRVPRVYWSHSKAQVLTLERVYGVPSDNVTALVQAGVDLPKLAAKGVRLFYQQVFRDNFFHADAHAGNIWVDVSRPSDPCFVAVDFGIMGALSPDDQWYLAANFEAVFQRNYRRVAQLHIEAGWIPTSVRVDALEAAIRAVCEPYFTRPLAEISLGEVVVKLFQVAHRYQLTIQPQLLLLQKTLLNIEGLGRLLDPKLDIWAVAQPVLAQILRDKYSFTSLFADIRQRWPEWIRSVPELPRLIHDSLRQTVQGDHVLNMRSADLHQLAETSRRTQRATVQAVLGAGLLIAGSVLWALGAPGPHLWGMPLVTMLIVSASAISFLLALRR